VAERLPAEKSDQGVQPESPTGAPRQGSPKTAQGDQGLLQLQRRAGNRTVLALLDVQAKLVVGRVDDPLEAEADAVASRVVHALQTRGVPAGGLVRTDADDEAPARRLRRFGNQGVGPDGGEVDSDVEQAITASGSGGRSLQGGILRGMEAAFGADFSAVRVHDGRVASGVNERLGALAFTHGRDIFFRDGMPNTSQAAGQHLLAHELAHTVQQGVARRVDPAPETDETGVGQRQYLHRNGPGIQRLFSGYYVVCGADEQGAARIDNDTHKPKRFYRTVASLSSKATKAKDQPFKLWNLWDDPEASALPVAVVEPEDGETDETAEPDVPSEDVDDSLVETEDATEPSTESEQVPTGSKKKRKKKKKKSGAPTTAPPTLAKDKTGPKGPPEAAWKTTYRSTSHLVGLLPAALEPNLKYIEKQLIDKSKNLEKAVNELADVWRPEFESDPAATKLEGEQAKLRAAMPTWDGNATTLTVNFNRMDTAVATARLAVTHAKEAGKLGDAIGSEGLSEMLKTFTRSEALTYAKAVGNVRLKVLLDERKVPAAVLSHYGAPLMKSFVGAGDKLWTHLVTASLNAQGAVSGGHDDTVFRDFIATKNYRIVDDPFHPEPPPVPDGQTPVVLPPPIVPTVYKVQYANSSGTTIGSKTLIQNLSTNKATWEARFDEAVWDALINKRLSDGSFTGEDGEGSSYDGFYVRDAFEVDTMWPS
jgi:hypothetical protein